jgi:hypothetical protein
MQTHFNTFKDITMPKTEIVSNMVYSDTNDGASVHKNAFIKKTFMT